MSYCAMLSWPASLKWTLEVTSPRSLALRHPKTERQCLVRYPSADLRLHNFDSKISNCIWRFWSSDYVFWKLISVKWIKLLVFSTQANRGGSFRPRGTRHWAPREARYCCTTVWRFWNLFMESSNIFGSNLAFCTGAENNMQTNHDNV